jgi:uncharacterized membrane protein
MAKAEPKLNRIAPWPFQLFFALLAIGWVGGSFLLGLVQGLLTGFDIAAAAFLLCCIPALRKQAGDMRDLAARRDANRVVLLVISVLLTLVIFAAVVAELGLRSELSLMDKLLIVASLILVWTFGNTVYALHYAHLFYSRDKAGGDRAGLKFPGTKEPMMSDFAYFAFTLGVAVQTSDVQVTSRHLRKLVTVHCVIGFFFNLGVLALTINVLGTG